jgi:hypothetical protein
MRVVATTQVGMQEPIRDDPAAGLLCSEPPGTYLLKCRGVWLLIWQISEGAPCDEALEPAEAWALSTT